jgi:hypothetical protein
MPSSMPVNKIRQKVIRDLRAKQDQEGNLPRAKLVLHGSAQQCSIYRLNIRELAFNKSNGRIKSEVVEKEAELGRQLDLFCKEDQKIIQEILLSIRHDENEKVKEDLQKNGQLTPGIVTCDGIVINGNRRKAIFEELYEETHQDKYLYLDVHVLPSDINRRELWLIEADIQMSASKQLDYSPINHLLKLREGIIAGLDIDDMASRIYGVTREDLEADLQRLTLIDEYLSEFIQKEGRYYLVKNANEHFIDLQKIIYWAQHPRGRIKTSWDWEESDINELKLVAFYYIRMRYTHMRIRDLRNIFAIKSAWNQAKKALKVGTVSEEQESTDTESKVTVSEEDEELDDQESTEPPITSFEEKDLQEEANWRKQFEPALKNLYEDAKEQEKIVKDSERPLALAKRALLNLQAIPRRPEKLTESKMDDVLAEIIENTNILRKLIGKSSRKKHK